MKRILALITVLILGIASVSIVTSQNPCEYVPPSECQECLVEFCQLSSIEAFFDCQEEWFHPYWMEVYNNEVMGCYARDLLCYNELTCNTEDTIPLDCPEEACENLCGDDTPCFLECCEKAHCYLYGQPSNFDYDGGAEIEPLVLTVPSCTDSRKFFSEPPVCSRFLQETDSAQLDGRGGPPGCCFDLRNCSGATSPQECVVYCDRFDLPANYRCDVNEYVIMGIIEGAGQVLINGEQYDYEGCGDGTPCTWWIVWYNGEKPFEASNEVVMKKGVPRTITIESKEECHIWFWLEQKCCYDCKEKPQLPATILYPKVDIETFSVPGGPTVISNGKVLSAFQMSPGSQQVFLQVENRGFFTQNDSRVRFDNLPEGVTVEVTPETQKITAHNLGTYSANFTVGPNVPSGTYQVTMIAYSSRGVFDKISFEFVVP